MLSSEWSCEGPDWPGMRSLERDITSREEVIESLLVVTEI